MGKDQELLEGARNGNVLVVEKILNQRAKRSGPLASLRRGPGANVQDTSGYTPLHHAALNGHREIVRLLLEHEASPNIPDTKGSSPLHLAAWAGHTDIVRLLLTHGPAFTNVNLATRDNETALHCAAQYGHTAVVSMLLNHGADPTVRSSRDESALDLACQYGRLETVELLVRMHPELLEPYRQPRGYFPHTPLHRASRNGHKAVVNILLSTGHAPNARTPSGTALHEAALCGKADVARALLAGGADPRVRDTKGATVLDVLAQFPERATHDIVKLINKYRNSNGVDSDSEDLPPIPVSNMIDGPDSPYDNIRTFTQSSLQGRGRSRGNHHVWERRDEDERRVSATSNISMNKQIAKINTSNSSVLKSNNPSSYMLLLTSGCFGGFAGKSGNKLSRMPSDCYKYEVHTSPKVSQSTLRIGKSKFFRRKSSEPAEKLIVLPKDTSIKVKKALPLPVRKKSSVIKYKPPSLPNILEVVEVASSSDESDKVENNPFYDSCEKVDRKPLNEPDSNKLDMGNMQFTIHSDSSASESDESDIVVTHVCDSSAETPILSARSSFEYQTSETDLVSIRSASSVKNHRRQSDSMITLKNWNGDQNDFKNVYSQVIFGYENVTTGSQSEKKNYHAMLDFSKMINSSKNGHEYEPIDFTKENKTENQIKTSNDNEDSFKLFKPIEIFKNSSTVFIDIDKKSDDSNSDVVLRKKENSSFRKNTMSDSESSSRSLSLVDSLDSDAKSNKNKIVSKIQRTLSKLSNKSKENRNSSLDNEQRHSKIVNVSSSADHTSVSSGILTSDVESRSSLESNESLLNIQSILKLSPYNLAITQNESSQVSTLRQIGVAGDPLYQNIQVIPNNIDKGKPIALGKSNYHLKGSEKCIYDSCKQPDHVYVYNHTLPEGGSDHPFIKIPKYLLGTSSDTTICFCDEGNQKIYISADNLLHRKKDSGIPDASATQFCRFKCYCSDSKCDSHYTKYFNDHLFITCKPLTQSVSFPNISFVTNEDKSFTDTKYRSISQNFDIVFETPLNDKPDSVCGNESSAFTKYETTLEMSGKTCAENHCDHVGRDSLIVHRKYFKNNSLKFDSSFADEKIAEVPKVIKRKSLEICKELDYDVSSSMDRKLAITIVDACDLKSDSFKNIRNQSCVASNVCSSLTDLGGRLYVRSGSDGGHYPYTKSQMMEGSYHSEELSSSYQSGRVREADQLSISSTTSSTGGPSPRERQRCGTNDSSVSGGNVYLPTGSSGYYAHSPGSNNKVSPTPPKKPPRRNLSVSPTHLLPPVFPSQGGTTGISSQSHHLSRAHQTRSQDDLDDIQVPGAKLAGLRHGRSVDQYVDNDLKTSPRARPVPQPRPSLALLASKKDQPVAISTMYENVVIKEQNPKRKLRRNQYENYQPGSGNHDDEMFARNQRYNSSQERSSLESLLDDVRSYEGGTPSDVESRPCRIRPTIQTPLSPTHYSQPPTPEHPPPSARQAEMSIHERMRPLSQEYKRMSRDMETEIDFRYLGRCSSPSSSASTDHCVEEYVAEIPFGGLFKGSTTGLDGVGLRPTPAERPKSLRTLKSVYDGGGGLFNYHPNSVNQNQIHHYNHQAYQGNHQNYQSSNQNYHGTQINPIDRTGMYKTELEDPWQYRAGREPKEDKKDATGSTGALEKSLSILSPFDEQEEWAKISEIMASFGSKLVRESVFAEELEREFQSRLGLASAIARRTPSPAPEALQEKPDTIPTWLNSIGLAHLELNFVNNGYDELAFINGVIEDNDFEEMAIGEPDKTKILEAVQSLPRKIDVVMSPPRTEDTHNNNVAEKNGEQRPEDPAAVDKWLQSIGLELYQDTFRKHLYTDMERVRRIWEVELTAVLEIQKVGHRRRILASVAGRQNGPVSNMEDIKADLNNLQKNLQNLKAEIKDIPIIESNISNPSQINQIPGNQVQKSPSIHSQTSLGVNQNNTSSINNVKNNTMPKNADTKAALASATPGGETLKRSHKKNRPPPPPPARDLEIRAPCELLVGVPGALKTQWRHQPFVLVTSSVMYVANYLGSTVVKELRGTESTQKSIQKLKKNNSEPRTLPDIILSISYRGVKFLNTITRELVCEHEIRNIHCACQDADDLTHFAYITKDIQSKNHYCHVFCVATMDQATEVILTLGQAFEVAYQMALREMAPKNNQQMPSQQPRSQSSNQISQQSKTPTHEKPVNVTTKDKNNPLHGRSHSVTEIKLNGHQLKVAPMTVSLSNEDFQLSAKNGNIQDSPRTPSTKAPIAVAEEL